MDGSWYAAETKRTVPGRRWTLNGRILIGGKRRRLNGQFLAGGGDSGEDLRQVPHACRHPQVQSRRERVNLKLSGNEVD